MTSSRAEIRMCLLPISSLHLRRNKYNVWYFKGYKDHPDGDGSKIWDYNVAKREAGLDGKRKIGSLKKKSSNKKARKK